MDSLDSPPSHDPSPKPDSVSRGSDGVSTPSSHQPLSAFLSPLIRTPLGARVVRLFTSAVGLLYPPHLQQAELLPTSSEVHSNPSAAAELPNEIWLHCFLFMTLKALIASRGVCKTWRQLVPLADLDPIRRRLLDLYDTVINSPHFYESRPWTVAHLEPFDREAYIAALESQYPAIPPEYRLFILEWPERAAIRSIWPGLPLLNCKTNNVQRARGTNFIARQPPQLSALVFKDGYPGVEFVPALLVWRRWDSTTWLVFDERHPELFGRVFVLLYPSDTDIIPYWDYGEEDRVDYGVLEPGGAYGDFLVREDWLAFLRWKWEDSGGAHRTLPPFSVAEPYDDVAVELRDDLFMDRSQYGVYQDVPAPPWVRREEPRFLRCLRKD
ncbi:unnamed protein product [Cyclocybe aegerita]|uniref:F-box domain-containing protein n=1 Tax=Cyclocybe aegerita TaxID=1973307 RepID=A0A8S0W3H5_CYCAE|nr:unnamed protein product [Cyclocybe aegerita]